MRYSDLNLCQTLNILSGYNRQADKIESINEHIRSYLILQNNGATSCYQNGCFASTGFESETDSITVASSIDPSLSSSSGTLPFSFITVESDSSSFFPNNLDGRIDETAAFALLLAASAASISRALASALILSFSSISFVKSSSLPTFLNNSLTYSCNSSVKSELSSSNISSTIFSTSSNFPTSLSAFIINL
ncbi:E3 ubiquitin-protein ligase SINAT5-like [Gossypium australe]|uniref:E3 ubiquitin-protein ligase SINAT5-like n=1 Tax=Gossypium australe TaxID=47621 RepID=A0A5B6W3Y1_9ROSI|nr:E3 ubiquitin-protein ligase SINAT5-like [Gossypium australe]